MGSFRSLPHRAMEIPLTEFQKLLLSGAKLLIGSEDIDSGPCCPVSGGRLVYSLLNPIRLAIGPCFMGVGDVRSSFCGNGLQELAKLANVLKGICGSCIAEAMFNGWEIREVPLVTRR